MLQPLMPPIKAPVGKVQWPFNDEEKRKVVEALRILASTGVEAVDVKTWLQDADRGVGSSGDTGYPQANTETTDILKADGVQTDERFRIAKWHVENWPKFGAPNQDWHKQADWSTLAGKTIKLESWPEYNQYK